jgi:hypothetical protein
VKKDGASGEGLFAYARIFALASGAAKDDMTLKSNPMSFAEVGQQSLRAQRSRKGC